MKHLIKYKLYENQNLNEIIQDIDDICLELKDKGFEIMKHSNGSKGFLQEKWVEYDLSIFKYKEDEFEPFEYEEVEEVVERLKDYMSQNGFQTDVTHRKNGSSYYKVILVFTLL